MDPIAGPRIVLRPGDESSSNRVLFDVPQARQPLAIVFNKHRPWTLTPNRSRASMFSIVVARIIRADSLHSARQRQGMSGRHLKVVVVVHQAESVNVHALQARSMADDPEEDVVVVVLIEDRHAVDASVHDVDAQAFDVDAKGTRHAGILSKRRTNCWATITKVFPRARTEIVAESAIYRAAVAAGTAKYLAPDRIPDPAPDRTRCPTLYLASSTGSVMNEGCCADRKTLCVAFR
jgi:hypothetical protein